MFLYGIMIGIEICGYVEHFTGMTITTDACVVRRYYSPTWLEQTEKSRKDADAFFAVPCPAWATGELCYQYRMVALTLANKQYSDSK